MASAILITLPGRIYIRRFRPSDLARILELENASFPKAPYPRELFEDLYRDCGPLFLVAHSTGAIAGYMVTCVAGNRAEIVSVAVNPEQRRAGVASALMRVTLNRLRARGAAVVSLMVREKNAAARKFYDGVGFRRVRRIPRYYENGAGGIRMTLVL